MSVRVYTSDMPGAPALTGLAGSLIGVLDACLITGFGAQMGSGWDKEFAGVNKAIYRAVLGNRLRLRVDDTGSTSAQVRGAETASDVDTIGGRFPNLHQQAVAGGLYIDKSSTADGTARPWMVVASDKALYLFVECARTGVFGLVEANTDAALFWGDLVGTVSGDLYCTALIAQTAAGTTTRQTFGDCIATLAGATAPSAGHFVARAYTQIGASIGVYKTSRTYGDNQGSATLGLYGAANAPYPDPRTGTAVLVPVEIMETLGGPESTPRAYINRGRLPGLYTPLHRLPGTKGQTIQGGPGLEGKTLMWIGANNGASLGRAAIDITSGGW